VTSTEAGPGPSPSYPVAPPRVPPPPPRPGTPVPSPGPAPVPLASPGESVMLVRPGAIAEAVNPGGVARAVAMWLAVSLLAAVLVIYGMGPLLEQREQRAMLDGYKASIERAVNQAGSLDGVKPPVKAPELGEPVGIVEIGSLLFQQVVVEGIAPSQTAKGPGHVPGTAGLGQAGNSVLLGRRAAFGAPFGDLERLRKGDLVLVTTTQGFVTYEVESTGTRQILAPGEVPPKEEQAEEKEMSAATPGSPAAAKDPTATSTPPGAAADPAADPAATAMPDDPEASTTAPPAEPAAGSDPAAGTPSESAAPPATAAPEVKADTRPIPVDELYGATPDDRLTLVTSGSSSPLNRSQALVVVAKMKGKPYEATPQGGRTDDQNGLGGDRGAGSALVLALLAYGAVLVVATQLYRRSSPLVAHVLTTAPMLALTVVVAESLVRLGPGWV
jgi:LPXTG-site transpeptidase (sortase) family protein